MTDLHEKLARMEPLTDLTLGDERYLAEMKKRIQKLRALARTNKPAPPLDQASN